MYDYSDITDMFKKKEKSKSGTVFTVVDFSHNTEHDNDPEDIIKFYKGYSSALYNKNKSEWNKHPIFTVGEKVNRKDDTLPLITEMQFQFSDKNKRNELNEQIETEQFAQNIISIHQKLIKEFFIISYDEMEYICVVCKSRLIRNGDNIIFRARFQFPYCVVKRDFLSHTFRKRLFQELEKLDTDDLFHLSCVSPDDEDDNEWNNYLLPTRDVYPLIGSSDKVDLPPVTFESIWGYDTAEEEIEELDLRDCYSIKTHSLFDEKYIGDEDVSFEEFEDEYEISGIGVPIFLSLFFYNKMSDLKPQFLSPSLRDGGEKEGEGGSVSGKEEILSTVSGSLEKSEDEYDAITDFEMFIDLVECLASKRFNTEMYMFDIGKCLFNCFQGGYDGLKWWIKYTNEKSTKYNEDFCHEHYPSFGDENFITVKTIGWYAKEDNFELYQQWHEKYCLPKMKLAISRETFPQVLVAQAFHRFFWLDYIYTGGKARDWYRFRNNRLNAISEESIRRDITEKFIPCFDRFRNQYMLEKINLSDKVGSSKKAAEDARDFEKTIKVIGQLIDRLLSQHYRSSIMMTIREYFEDSQFFDKIDINPNLLGAFNCVIELTPTGAFTRTGKPEDYITKKMGVSYSSEYDYNHRNVKDALKYLRQVFPEKSIFEFVLKDNAAMLYGKNVEKTFRCYIGDTNGSKSIYQAIHKKMFGDYYKDLPNEFYSGTRSNPSGPTPELAQLSGARVVYSTEPDAGLNFRGDKIKLITGSDSQFGRGCKENGGSINPSYNAIMVMNRIPNISNLDEATKERFGMFPFEGRWVRDEEDIGVPEEFEEQIKQKLYRMDKRFEKNIPRLAMGFLWLAVENYAKYMREGNKRPPYMKKFMKDHWKANDPYLCYIDEHIIKKEKQKECSKCDGDDCKRCKDGYITVPDTDHGLRSKDIYPMFKKWLRKGDHNMRAPTQGQFTKDMSTRDKLGKQVKWVWQGYALRADESDEEDSDEE